MKEIDYIKKVIKQYEVDLSSLKEIDKHNLFAAIETALNNVGEKQFADKLHKEISLGADIYQIAAVVRDVQNRTVNS